MDLTILALCNLYQNPSASFFPRTFSDFLSPQTWILYPFNSHLPSLDTPGKSYFLSLSFTIFTPLIQKSRRMAGDAWVLAVRSIWVVAGVNLSFPLKIEYCFLVCVASCLPIHSPIESSFWRTKNKASRYFRKWDSVAECMGTDGPCSGRLGQWC